MKGIENNKNRAKIELLNTEIENIALEVFGKDRPPTREEIGLASQQVTKLMATRELLYWMGRVQGDDVVGDEEVH